MSEHKLPPLPFTPLRMVAIGPVYMADAVQAYAIESIQVVSKPRDDMATWRSRFMAWRGRQATDQEVWDAAIASVANTSEQG